LQLVIAHLLLIAKHVLFHLNYGCRWIRSVLATTPIQARR